MPNRSGAGGVVQYIDDSKPVMKRCGRTVRVTDATNDFMIPLDVFRARTALFVALLAEIDAEGAAKVVPLRAAGGS